MLPPVGETTELLLPDGRRLRLQAELLPALDPIEAAASDSLTSPLRLLRPLHAAPKPQRQEQLLAPGAIVPGRPRALVLGPPALPPAAPDSPLWDSPCLGGKLTCFVLCFGHYYDLARRCLESILATLPLHRRDLRVICNQCQEKTLQYVTALQEAGQVQRLYVRPEQPYKYVAMRELFHSQDPADAIATPWLAWFDDDSWAKPGWSEEAARVILSAPSAKLLGIKFFHDVSPKNGKQPVDWFRAAPWWRNRPLLDKRGREVPGGSKVFFVTGAFWLLASEAIRAANIPCPRLRHQGGDITIGAQIQQTYGIEALKDLNRNKKLVHSSDSPRRGHREAFPWAQ